LEKCAGSIAISDTDVQALLKVASKLMEEKHQKLSEVHN
jgi:CheY-specific phosphatase CheX